MGREPEPEGRRRHGEYTLSRLAWRDLHQVVALERAVFPEPIRPGTLVRLYLRPEVTYLAAHPEGSPRHLAAYYGFECLPDGHGAHVLANSTHPDDRRRGLARAIVTWGLDLARAKGVRWIVGEVRVSNVGQMAFMEMMGWKVGDRIPHFFVNGEDAWMVYRCME
jgi:ribosomal-protein-alanine N-acetyltransferase